MLGVPAGTPDLLVIPALLPERALIFTFTPGAALNAPHLSLPQANFHRPCQGASDLITEKTTPNQQ